MIPPETTAIDNSTNQQTNTSLESGLPHPFAPFVRILGRGKRGTRSLTQAEAREAMTMILHGKVEPVQLGAFLMLLRVKEETPEELSGFIQAVKEDIQLPAEMPTVHLDWSSYAGKRRHLPWFLLSILLLVENGYRVFIHGAEGVRDDRIYTPHALEALGFPLAKGWNDVANQLCSQGFSYLSLDHISPVLGDIIRLRPVLGLRSPVHSLSRLINPLNAPNVMQGIFHPAYNRLHQQSGLLLDYPNLAVFKGEGGEIERNPDARVKVYRVHQGEMREEDWPSLHERRHLKPDHLCLDTLKSVWRGEKTDEYGISAVIGTVALAIEMMGVADNQDNALDQATDWWKGRNRQHLDDR